MKTRQELDIEILISEVISSTSKWFKPTVDQIKMQIDSLISKEFLLKSYEIYLYTEIEL